MNTTPLQYAIVCPICNGAYPEYVIRNFSNPVRVMEVECSHCKTHFITPGNFTGMRSIAICAEHLLMFWDKTHEVFADLWTFYHDHHVSGYKQPYEELFI